MDAITKQDVREAVASIVVSILTFIVLVVAALSVLWVGTPPTSWPRWSAPVACRVACHEAEATCYETCVSETVP